MISSAFAFDRQEFEQRQQRLKIEMERNHLSAIVVSAPENIFYLSGYQTKAVFTFQFLLFPLNGPLRLFTRQMEITNAIEAHDAAGFDEYQLYQDDQDPMEQAQAFLQQHLLPSDNVGLELNSWCLSAQRAHHLTKGVNVADWVDVSTLIDRLRLIKTPREMAALREAGRIGDAISDRAQALISPGRGENELAAEVMTAIVQEGSEYPGSWPNIMVGQRTGRIHAAWDGTVIQPNDHVTFELTGVIQRYHAPSWRTVLVGDALPEVRHAAEVLVKAQRAAVAAMEVGRPMRVINQAVEAVLATNDPRCSVAKRSGYSLGIGFPPSWGAQWQIGLNSQIEDPLKVGMAFHVVCVGHLAEGRAVCIGSTVALTDNGAEELTQGGLFTANNN